MRKKLFAVIMSIMMMVTFMPTMAFAAGSYYVQNVTWDFNAQTATVKYSEKANGSGEWKTLNYSFSDLDRMFVNDDVKDADLPTVLTGVGFTAESLRGAIIAYLPTTYRGETLNYGSSPSLNISPIAIYYDFTGATMVNKVGKKEKVMQIAADDYCNMVDQTGTQVKLKSGHDITELLGGTVKFVEPASLAGTATPTTAYVSADAEVKIPGLNGSTKYIKIVGNIYNLSPVERADGIFSLATANAVLPTYEKYQDNGNFPVSLTFKRNPILDVANGILPVGAITSNEAVEHQVYIYSDDANTVELTMDGISTPKCLNLYSSKQALVKALFENPGNRANKIINCIDFAMLGFYSGSDLNLHATTKGVDVQYSTDFGETWGAAPEIKNANISYAGLVLEVVENLANLGYFDPENGNIPRQSAVKALLKNLDPVVQDLTEKLFDSIVYVKVTKGSSTQYGYVLPLVLPRELMVEFKNSQLNFAPGKNLTSSNVLEAKAITGNGAVSSLFNSVMQELKKVDMGTGEGAADVDLVNPLKQLLGLLGTEKTGIYEADKAYAEKFVEKYFKLQDMPAAGTNNQVSFKKNVKIDFNALLSDMKTDAELALFMNNYDLLPELMMLDLSSLGNLPLGISVGINGEIVVKGTAISGDAAVSTDIVQLIKSLLGLADNGVISTATVNYDKEYTTITAKKLTKTFHVKKAKALKAKKTFKYKATTDYGNLEYKKLSGNKKITVRDDGKVTVKKGLKKGTYTVRVKVSVPQAGKYVKKSVKVKIVK